LTLAGEFPFLFSQYARGLLLSLGGMLLLFSSSAQHLCGFDQQLTIWLETEENRKEWERTEERIFERYWKEEGRQKKNKAIITHAIKSDEQRWQITESMPYLKNI
jgi:hypothetical protein